MMNFKITLGFLCFFTFLSLHAQNYKPMLDQWNEWHLISCYNGCLTDVYFTDGDTLVGGKNYKILDGFHYISRSFLIREEVENQKVYFTTTVPGFTDEYLLYDFSLTVGDSIDMKNPISPFEHHAGYYQVDSILRKPLVDGNLYRHYYLSPTPSNTVSTNKAAWIEGMGSLSMINAPSGNPDYFSAGRIGCFFKENELFFSAIDSVYVNDCIPIILETETFSPEDDWVIYSNQSSSVVTLGRAKEVERVEIFDISGRKIAIRQKSGNDEIFMDFSSQSAGTYFIIAHSSSKKRTFRVVIQN